MIMNLKFGCALLILVSMMTMLATFASADAMDVHAARLKESV